MMGANSGSAVSWHRFVPPPLMLNWVSNFNPAAIKWLMRSNEGRDNTAMVELLENEFIILAKFGEIVLSNNQQTRDYTLWVSGLATMFCKAFLTCSTGRWDDTGAMVQPNW